MYKLTSEGREYLEKGLPEMNLVNSIKKPTSLEYAKNKIENFNIAVMWAKKNNWIKIEKGKIIVTGKPGKSPEYDALKKIDKNQNIDNKAVSLLLKRNLILKIDSSAEKKAEKFIGKEITNLSPELIKTGLWRKAKIKSYNVEAVGKKIHAGKKQPYIQFLSKAKQKLVEMGFKEMNGHLIETEFWNFDSLYQAQNHPSRDWTQTYTLKYPKYGGDVPNKKIVKQIRASHENGWKTGSTGWGYTWSIKKASHLMPRAHTTASSARQLAKGIEIPGKYFIIGRNYRPDVIDSTHGVEFNHCEGIVIDPSLNFKHLLGLLKEFAIEFAGAEEVKFIPDYYPFVEPGVQLSAKHPEMGWIELAGAGVFRPELTEPLGVKEPVLAWGLGIDRLAMFKLGIKDIRELFSKNLDWLRNQKVI